MEYKIQCTIVNERGIKNGPRIMNKRIVDILFY